MAYLYFDESIRERGGFIVGALVVAKADLSNTVRETWREIGLDPDIFEYKSSTPKVNDPRGQKQRGILGGLLQSASLALTICPCTDRRELGKHCASLVSQLHATGLLALRAHDLFLDQNIFIPKDTRDALVVSGVSVHLN
jgi:hypothetical protein